MVSRSPRELPHLKSVETATPGAGTRYGGAVEPAFGSNGRNRQHWSLRARLFGGSADGRTVGLDSLIPGIAVYVTDSGTIACDRELPHPPEGSFAGNYDLVTGSGPEPPTYVASV
jgi:hypothetical protein